MTVLERYVPADADDVARLNTAYYRDVHGFDATFGDAVSGALSVINPAVATHTGAGWVLRDADAPAGSLFLTGDGPSAGRIRLFFVRPDLQGRGLGRALLAQCLREAGPLGFDTLRVSTFTIHEAACALYLKSGFKQERETDCQMFGRTLTQVDFARNDADET